MPRWSPCSEPGCPQLTTRSGRCDDCRKATDLARGSRHQRGYDSRHDKRRAILLPQAIGNACPLCGEPMVAGQALDLDHTVPLKQDSKSIGDRITHARCNRARRD